MSESYFVIIPKRSMISILDINSHIVRFESLREPLLWAFDEVCLGEDSQCDATEFVKLLFLYVIKVEFSSMPEFSFSFQDLSITPDFFDEYWKIERLVVNMSAREAVLGAAHSKTFDMMIPSGNENIDEYLLWRKNVGGL